MVIYLDVLLAVNWVIDFLLLHAVARFTAAPHRGGRLVAGAAVGAASCCVVLWPSMPAPLSVAVKVAAALAMVAAAFGVQSVRALCKRTVALFVLSAAVSGVATAVWWLAAPRGLRVIHGVVYCDISPLWLIALTAASYGLLCLYHRWTQRRAPRGHQFWLRVDYGGRRVTVPALYDSGNRLTEPFSGAPVAVAEYAALAELLPPDWETRDTSPPHGARMIPFSSVGGKGLLPAFRPDRLAVVGERGEWETTGAFVAVTGRLGRGEYAALISPDFMEGERALRKAGVC